ncbi:hypothetical protein GCM10023215_67120 [Pseudonocardia yuanmonensis]|uniref:Uncharacterized protein n=1 Tax=Pseudonocardia yuanmonensis TaxID=1095914 RepID=A0ABP8XW60_9PSEU
MFRTATTDSIAAFVAADSDWREFSDRDAHQDRIASGLAGALDEPGF